LVRSSTQPSYTRIVPQHLGIELHDLAAFDGQQCAVYNRVDIAKNTPPEAFVKAKLGRPGLWRYKFARGDVITPLAGPGQPAGLSAPHEAHHLQTRGSPRSVHHPGAGHRG
jgi:hypothetical protein